MLIEKVWAKVNGNYEVTNGGNPMEFFDFIGGVPVTAYSNTDASTINSNGALAF